MIFSVPIGTIELCFDFGSYSVFMTVEDDVKYMTIYSQESHVLA